MTATTQPASAVFTGPGIPLSRLIKVELRKLVDTRASFWLAASIAAISAIIGVVVLIVGPGTSDSSADGNITFANLFDLMTAPMAFLLPVMAILLVTSEWSQRNALTTFTMEPRRERVIVAKLTVSIIASIAAVVIALALGALCNLVGGLIYSDGGEWSISGSALVSGLLNILVGVLVGFAFAALLLNTPAAIVAYFVIPTVLEIIGAVVPWINDHLIDWIRLPMLASSPSGSDWAHFLSGCVIWFAIPLFFGVNRIMRSEVK
ncbi:ABC transporter permease [Gordonia sp. HY285]|uniref:ABC transporter permease n=1 Tax=Gordonia liuliyuniae TaxID=2911517 RepID=A0ABS9IX23_9ACTN|nr:ABC transporter permease [Gordonia liuliyuniae]MCF8590120.1 ABC transporter permease [Gordonia liuliyuniae]MCF8610260.1 ABC transporter permease [Gordonia liuliyuniae]